MQDSIAKNTVTMCRRAAFYLLVGATILLGGCETIPDAVNPFAWFEDDESAPPPPAAAKPGAAAAENQAYPKLGAVPKRPSLESQQASIGQGLAADSENARYTDEKIQREVARRAAGPQARAPVSAVPAPRPVPPAPRVSAPGARATAPRPVQPPPSRSTALASPPSATVPVPRPRAVPRPVPAVPAAPPAARTVPVPPIAAPTARATPPAPPPAPAFAPGQTVRVATIYFRDGSTKLQGDDQAILRQIAAAQRQSGSAVRVVGHASGRVRTFDPSRRHMINYQVSLDRAHAVAAALLSLGVPVGRLQVEGKGDTAPVYAEYSATGEAANRRAELYFVN